MLTKLFILATVSSAALAQCGASDHPNCPNWVANGFCNNGGYTLLDKQKYCGKACNLCPGASCVDAHPNCAGFKAGGFCDSNTFTADQKKEKCCATCAPQIAASCAKVELGSGSIVPIPTAGTGTFSAGTAAAYQVQTGCSLEFFQGTNPVAPKKTGNGIIGPTDIMGAYATVDNAKCTCP